MLFITSYLTFEKVYYFITKNFQYFFLFFINFKYIILKELYLYFIILMLTISIINFKNFTFLHCYINGNHFINKYFKNFVYRFLREFAGVRILVLIKNVFLWKNFHVFSSTHTHIYIYYYLKSEIFSCVIFFIILDNFAYLSYFK